MESWEVATLRRSLAMADQTLDPDTVARVLATAEGLFNQRAEIRAILLRAKTAPAGALRGLLRQIAEIVGEAPATPARRRR